MINDICRNDYRISQFIADNLKRSVAKQCQNHASWFPCEYCYCKGTKIEIVPNKKAIDKIHEQQNTVQELLRQCRNQEMTAENVQKIDYLASLEDDLKKSEKSLKKRSNILWPYKQEKSPHRSRASVLEIVEKIENGEELSIDERKGILGRSIFLNLENFNFVYDSPAEYLHSGCLGVIKKMTELTFDVVQKKRSRNSKRKLSSTKDFNKLMSVIKVPREFPRRARNLDFAVFKGQEFRNLAIFYFPLVVETIEINAKERNLWLYQAFMVRAAVIPSVEFQPINLKDIEDICDKFYELFEELMGISNCTYNLHVFCAHLLEIRTHGPLTETSAFKFESFYGEMRRSFVPGTGSPMKQVLRNILMKRILKKHQCRNTISVTNYDTSLECNKLIYTYVNKEYKFYEVSDINNNVFFCHQIGKYPVVFPETPEINWSSVGVFKKGALSNDVTKLRMSDISGKVIKVGNLLLTCPENILNEK